MAEIIVVDGEEDVRSLLADCLGGAGHVLRSAGDATALVRLPEDGPPDASSCSTSAYQAATGSTSPASSASAPTRASTC